MSNTKIVEMYFLSVLFLYSKEYTDLSRTAKYHINVHRFCFTHKVAHNKHQ